MALYVCVVLLAALEAVGKDGPTGQSLELVWGTTVGLAVAHVFAFAWASRLLDHGTARFRRAGAIAHLTGAVSIAVPVSIVILALPHSTQRDGARIAAAGLIGIVSYGETRWSGASRPRALGVAVLALAAGITAALIKNSIGSH